MTLPEIVGNVASEIKYNPKIHAMWLEGSYVTGKFNEKSDIDVWLDVDDEMFEGSFNAVRKVLQDLRVLRKYEELNYYSKDPVLAKAKFYLADKTDDQRIELDIQPHSRQFKFSKVEHKIKILFDKDATIQWQE